MGIKISGSLTVKDDEKGQQYTIDASDFNRDDHLDRMATSFSYKNDMFSIEIIAEEKGQSLSTDNWQTKGCSILKNKISFSLE